MGSIKVNLVFNTLQNVSKVIFPLISAPYVTRVLSPSDIGIYNFGFIYATYFSLFALLGIPNYGAREIAKVRDNQQESNRVFNELFSIAVFNTLIITVIYIATIFSFEKFENHLLFLTIGIFLYCTPFNIDWFYGGLENFKHITIRSLVTRFLGIILLFVFVRDSKDLIVYVIITAFATVASDVWNFVVFYKSGYSVSISFHGIKKHIKPLLVLFASALAVSIYTVLDTLMLGFFSKYEEVAYYTYGMHISKSLLAAITSLSAVAVPRISYYMVNRKFEEINILVNKSFSLVSFFAFPICIGIIIIAPVLIPLFLGEHFMGTVLPLQILSSLIIIIGLNNLSAIQCLVGLGFDKLFLYSVLVGTITNFGLNLILIPLYGAVGASIASVVAEICVLIISYYFVYHSTPLHIIMGKELLFTLIASSFLWPLYLVLKQFVSGWMLILLFILTSFCLYLVIQNFTKNTTLLIFENIIKHKFIKK